MRRPDPPVQLRQFLTVAKRQGIPFEQAWESAFRRTCYPHDKTRRKDYYAATAWAKPYYEAAYHDRDVAGGRAALVLMDSLHDDRDESAPTQARPAPTLNISKAA